MMHENCGKQTTHTISAEIKSKIREIWNMPELEECNFIHFQEILEEDYHIRISYTPLYKFLKSKGAKSPRKHKKAKAHNRRQERASSGELLQVDGTPHRFFIMTIKSIVCMVSSMMQLIRLQGYICAKTNVCMAI